MTVNVTVKTLDCQARIKGGHLHLQVASASGLGYRPFDVSADGGEAMIASWPHTATSWYGSPTPYSQGTLALTEKGVRLTCKQASAQQFVDLTDSDLRAFVRDQLEPPQTTDEAAPKTELTGKAKWDGNVLSLIVEDGGTVVSALNMAISDTYADRMDAFQKLPDFSIDTPGWKPVAYHRCMGCGHIVVTWDDGNAGMHLNTLDKDMTHWFDEHLPKGSGFLNSLVEALKSAVEDMEPDAEQAPEYLELKARIKGDHHGNIFLQVKGACGNQPFGYQINGSKPAPAMASWLMSQDHTISFDNYDGWVIATACLDDDGNVEVSIPMGEPDMVRVVTFTDAGLKAWMQKVSILTDESVVL